MHRVSPFALGLLGWLREAVFFLLGAWLAAPARLCFATWALLIALLITYPATLQAYQDYAKCAHAPAWWGHENRVPTVHERGYRSRVPHHSP